MNIWRTVIVPFLIWIFSEAFLVGFFFPILGVFKYGEEQGVNFDNKTNVLLCWGFGRIKKYKWELFFSSLGGIIITDIYWAILALSEKFLPLFLYILVSAGSSFIFCVSVFSKADGIMSKPPSFSLIRGLKHVFGVFRNPFNQSVISRMKEVMNKMNNYGIEFY